jgi:hypothetical protein
MAFSYLENQRHASRSDRSLWLLGQVHGQAPAGIGPRGDHTHEFAPPLKSVRRIHQGISVHFSEPHELKKSLGGVDVLINTYWVRFDNPPHFTFAPALANAKVLFDAAKRADVGCVVHISITNPDRESYFSEMEDYLKQSGMSYAILRPAVLFGKEDILINNIAW